jgi:hypothetical protein
VADFFDHQKLLSPAGLPAQQKFFTQTPAGKIHHIDLIRKISAPEGLMLGNAFYQPDIFSAA